MIKGGKYAHAIFFCNQQFNFVFGHTLIGRLDQISPEVHFNLHYFTAL